MSRAYSNSTFSKMDSSLVYITLDCSFHFIFLYLFRYLVAIQLESIRSIAKVLKFETYKERFLYTK